MHINSVKEGMDCILIMGNPSTDWKNGLCKVQKIHDTWNDLIEIARYDPINPNKIIATYIVESSKLYSISDIQLMLNPYWEPGY